jgi:hypothetical protein
LAEDTVVELGLAEDEAGREVMADEETGRTEDDTALLEEAAAEVGRTEEVAGVAEEGRTDAVTTVEEVGRADEEVTTDEEGRTDEELVEALIEEELVTGLTPDELFISFGLQHVPDSLPRQVWLNSQFEQIIVNSSLRGDRQFVTRIETSSLIFSFSLSGAKKLTHRPNGEPEPSIAVILDILQFLT